MRTLNSNSSSSDAYYLPHTTRSGRHRRVVSIFAMRPDRNKFRPAIKRDQSYPDPIAHLQANMPVIKYPSGSRYLIRDDGWRRIE